MAAVCWCFSTFVCSVPFVLIEPDCVGPRRRGGWRLHVGQVLRISQVSQHVLQLGSVWPCFTGQFKGVSKQRHSDEERRKKKQTTNRKYKKSSTVREEQK